MVTLYEHVIVALLTESKIDTLARRLTQKVVNAVKKKGDDLNKKGFLKLNMKVAWPSFLKRSDQFDTPVGRLARTQLLGGQGPSPFGPMELNLKLLMVIDRKSTRNDVGINASWNPMLDELQLQLIVFSPEGVVTKQHLSSVQREAYNAIRHELEHSTQSLEKIIGAAEAGREMMSGVPREAWKSAKSLGGYLMSEAEIEAWTAGMYHKAKRTRQPLIKVIDDTIEHLMRTTTRAGSEAVEMRNVLMQVRWKWIEYAKKRFPRAQLQ